MVAAVDIAHLRGVLKREGNPTCSFGSGDVENFSRWLQASLHLPGYHLPLVGGDGEGAEMAYSLAAQADTQPRAHGLRRWREAQQVAARRTELPVVECGR
ncbi:hypothetical protein G6F63_015817 [Rhizopus arrhizus]|nr:hypothetical protein G6F63_015817 [Rhizopus arrhizus]